MKYESKYPLLKVQKSFHMVHIVELHTMGSSFLLKLRLPLLLADF